MKRKIISGNRITIPNHLMEELNLKTGDFVDIQIKKHFNPKEGIIIS